MSVILALSSISSVHAEEIPADEQKIVIEDSYDTGTPPEYHSQDEIVIPAQEYSTDSQSTATGITVDYHTPEEIRAFYQAHPVYFSKPTYSVMPDSTNPPYAAGVLSDESLQDALNAVNLVRFIAGLDHEVTLNSEYTRLVQAGALVNAVNNSLSHFPEKPEGIDEDLYKDGYNGNSSANIAMGFPTLANAVTDAWLNDGDTSNISRIGHRRWLLNAHMGQTGFGHVGAYTGMYAFDFSGNYGKTSNVWPAQNTPVEFFTSEYPWSVSTGTTEDIASVNVVLTNNKTGAVYNFSSSAADGYFNVENGNYGAKGAVIFRPDGLTYNDGDSYNVSITGLQNGDINYDVNFFKLDDSEPQMVITPSVLNLKVGETGTADVSFTPATTTDRVSSWSWNNSNITFSHTAGVFTVTANSVGTCKITITSKNGLTGVLTVNVTENTPVAVTGVSVSPDSLAMEIGETAQLSASVQPSDAYDTSVIWSSSDPSVATVDQNGFVTAVAGGSAQITVKTNDGGYTASCDVDVAYAPLIVDFVSEGELIAGNTITLSASAQGGKAPYQYRFTEKHSAGWTTIQNYSDNSELVIHPENGGEAHYCVYVKDANGTIEKKTLILQIDEVLEELTLSVDIPDEIIVGGTYSINALAQGGKAPYKFRFTEKTAEGWKTIRNWGTSAELSINPEVSGTVRYCVYVKDSNGTESKLPFSITAEEALEELTIDVNVPEVTVNESADIIITAAGGKAPYQYMFKEKSGTSWITVQNWSDSDTLRITPDEPGRLRYCAFVKDSAGNETKQVFDVNVTEPLEELQVNLAIPVTVTQNEPVQLTASAQGGKAPYQYKFTVKENGSWITLQAFSKSATVTWTPSESGTIPVAVQVKDSAGNTVKYPAKVKVLPAN